MARDGEAQAANQLTQQGQTHYQMSQFADAVISWTQAVTLYAALGDPLNQAAVLNHLCLAYQKLGQWEQAQTAVEQSRALLQRLAVPGAIAVHAQALNTQGHLHLAQGQPEVALKTWKQAETLYAQIGDQKGHTGSLINQAQALQVLGLYLQSHKTLERVNQALQAQSDPQIQAIGWRSLSNVKRVVGDLEESHQLLTRSLAAAQQLDSPSQIEAIYLDLGNTARAQEHPEIALSYYQKAAQSTQEATRLQAQLNQLRLWVERANRSEVEALWPSLAAQLLQLPTSRDSVYHQIHLAQSLIQLRQQDSFPSPTWSEIAPVVTTAVEQARTLNDPRAEAYALGYLGQLHFYQRQWPQAIAVTQQALVQAQSILATDLSYQWQWQLGRIYHAQNQRLAAIAAYTTAFESLQSLRQDLVATNLDVQFSFREQVEPVYRELVDLLLDSSAGAVSPAQLEQARDVIEALQLVELENYFRSACLDHQLVKIDQVDQTGTAVLYPILLPDRIELILSLPQQPLRQYTTAVSPGEVATTLEQLRSSLEAPYTDPQGKQLALQVYNWLIQPAKAALDHSQIHTLTFVLDGPLRNLPMAALYDGQQYLVEHYSLALTPGLQLLSPQPLQQRTLRILAAGVAAGHLDLPPLPHVPFELAQIKALLPGQFLLDDAFTSNALREQIDVVPFPIVHLATHGQFSSKADETFLLAWDRKLNVDELSALLQTTDQARSRPIELLVLSACETAAGDQRAALGLAGIAVRAGARSTLASLWSLDDRSAAYFASEFYRALIKGKLSKAEALRQAQRALLADPDYRHPFHWAPYVLVGNWL
jgi:CHAT domain-containing protein